MQKQANRKCIAQGAQAIVYLEQREINGSIVKTIIKQRPQKKYRHPQLDEKINRTRQNTEAKNMQKALKGGLYIPKVIKQVNNQIHMDYIEGPTAKQFIHSIYSLYEKQTDQNVKKQLLQSIKQLLIKIGKQLSKMHHKVGLIHGDLTTSNMIVRTVQDQQRIYFIDFGLSASQKNVQDQAVDLYVLEKAFVSTHSQLEKQFAQYLLAAYGNQAVLKRLDAVRMRGRKKVAFG